MKSLSFLVSTSPDPMERRVLFLDFMRGILADEKFKIVSANLQISDNYHEWKFVFGMRDGSLSSAVARVKFVEGYAVEDLPYAKITCYCIAARILLSMKEIPAIIR